MADLTGNAKREFDRWSRHYNWNPLQLFFFGPSHRMLLESIEPADRRILDVGCGTGIFAGRLLRQFPSARVWGLDLSDGMLHKCQARPEVAEGHFHVVQGDSQRLPFPDDAFDVVTCCHSFHHYPSQARVLQEMHRVLRPGGKLLILDGDRDHWWGHLLFDVVVVWAEGPVRHVSGSAFRRLYRDSGFNAIRQQRRRGPLPFLLTMGHAVKPGCMSQPARAA
jgi:ubiquinone/menaquinone biosynthesis C-methylase UbiE